MSTQTEYHRQTATFLAKVGENMPILSPTEMQRWIDQPKDLQRFLTGLRTPQGLPTFPTFRRVGRGAHTSMRSSRKALKRAGCKEGYRAPGILERADWSDPRTELELVVVTNADLGFSRGAARSEIYRRAHEVGLTEVPHWAGPALREQYQDQRPGEWLLMGQSPIVGALGGLWLFTVSHQESRLVCGLWLGSASGSPGTVWQSNVRWVFARRT